MDCMWGIAVIPKCLASNAYIHEAFEIFHFGSHVTRDIVMILSKVNHKWLGCDLLRSRPFVIYCGV